MVQESVVKPIPLLIIAGPTGVGKTEIALNLYDLLKSTLISADSMQVYRECNVATAKLSENLLKKYPHYNINIKNIEEEYSVAEFKKDTIKAINISTQKGELPIIVGGTGLYIEGLLFPYDFANCPKDINYRKELDNILQTKGKEQLYKMLFEIDEKAAIQVSMNDTKKVKRILEICHTTNKKYSQIYSSLDNFEKSPYDYFIVFLNKERQTLYSDINQRVDYMIKEGLIDEAYYIYETEKKLNKQLQVSNAIGYKELFSYFDGNDTLNNAIDKIKQHSRNYAKRQITWYKRYTKNIMFLSNETKEQKNAIIKLLFNKYQQYKK